jgi:hypothetical protein
MEGPVVELATCKLADMICNGKNGALLIMYIKKKLCCYVQFKFTVAQMRKFPKDAELALDKNGKKVEWKINLQQYKLDRLEY